MRAVVAAVEMAEGAAEAMAVAMTAGSADEAAWRAGRDSQDTKAGALAVVVMEAA